MFILTIFLLHRYFVIIYLLNSSNSFKKTILIIEVIHFNQIILWMALQPKHVIIRLFEPPNTIGVILEKLVKYILILFQLTNKGIVCIKNKGANLNTLKATLSSMVTCVLLTAWCVLICKFMFWSCYVQTMLVCNEWMTCWNFVLAWRKSHLNMHKKLCKRQLCGLKVQGMGRQKWDKACIKLGLPTWKLKTPMKIQFINYVVLFQKTFKYVDSINICYHSTCNQSAIWFNLSNGMYCHKNFNTHCQVVLWIN